MPVHYAKDTNVLRGTAIFNNSKSALALFIADSGIQRVFDSEPIIVFNIRDNGGNIINPAYKGPWKYDNNNKVIGITILFSTKITATVDWILIAF